MTATNANQNVIPNLGDDVIITPYTPGDNFLLFLQPRAAELRSDPEAVRHWFTANRAAIDALLIESGALVLRGFAIPDTTSFGALIDSYDAPNFGYTAGAAPRGQLAPRVFETTVAPAHVVLGLHQEMAYLPNYPKRVAFYCRVAAVTGGETHISNFRRVTAEIDREFYREVEQRGVLYTRNFRDKSIVTGVQYLDVMHRSWQDAFSTEDRDKVIDDCNAMGLEAKWLDDGSVSTYFRAPGIIDHPQTKERIWFNQIATLIINSDSVGDNYALYQRYYGVNQRDSGDSRPYPYDSAFGDGARFPQQSLKDALDLYEKYKVAFPWSYGDVLLLDNFITAHGRNCFTGLRDIQVALLN